MSVHVGQDLHPIRSTSERFIGAYVRKKRIEDMACSRIFKTKTTTSNRSRMRTKSFRTCASSQPDAMRRLGTVIREKAAADWKRLTEGTQKSRASFSVVDELSALWNLEESDEILEEIEEALLSADLGPVTSRRVAEEVREGVKLGELRDGGSIRGAVKNALVNVLRSGGNNELVWERDEDVARPAVAMIVGVNGGGKTTTIGKLAHRCRTQGRHVMLAAGDTFRAAAGDQLQAWAHRTQAAMGPVRMHSKPSGVLYASVQAAIEEGVDVLLADTSGRLHTNTDLMMELEGCKKSLSKALGRDPDEVLLVLDGTTGLNMLGQAKEFAQTVGVTGLILTKIDGTAKGGAVVGVVDVMKLPVKFVGVGEGIDDLQPFDPEAFVEALLPGGSNK